MRLVDDRGVYDSFGGRFWWSVPAPLRGWMRSQTLLPGVPLRFTPGYNPWPASRAVSGLQPDLQGWTAW